MEWGKVWSLSKETKLKKLKSKIIITGEPGAGKSFIAQATDACIPSQEIGVSIGKISETIEETSLEMTLMTWAITEGRPKKSTHLENAHAAIIVCDISKPKTVIQSTEWANRILDFSGDIPLFFVANNADIESSDTSRLLRKVAHRYNSAYYPIFKKERKSARDLLGLIAWEISDNMTNKRTDKLVSW
jgi:signal recognition particle receptor subunit beta